MTSKPGTLTDVSWAEFEKLGPAEKASLMGSGNSLFHVLYAQQFDRARLDDLCELATQIRQIAKSKPGMDFLRQQLFHKTAMLYFGQPSTRTFLSFHSACQILGMKTVEVRDKSTSSELKGETLEDSVRTFSSFSDVIIMRHSEKGLAEKMAWTLSNTERPVPIINAGSGKDQHPTQALLDIYTLQRSFEKQGGIDNKTVVFVGDLARGRTVRSLAQLLTKYDNVKQVFAAPEKLQIGGDILDILKNCGVEYELTHDFKKIIPEADAIYMTRVQDEWDEESGASSKIDVSGYAFAGSDLQALKPNSVIMHPLPRRAEIALDVDHDRRAVYWRQVRNGMWARVALLAHIFEVDAGIRAFHGQ